MHSRQGINFRDVLDGQRNPAPDSETDPGISADRVLNFFECLLAWPEPLPGAGHLPTDVQNIMWTNHAPSALRMFLSPSRGWARHVVFGIFLTDDVPISLDERRIRPVPSSSDS
jgi:hypothetical protein